MEQHEPELRARLCDSVRQSERVMTVLVAARGAGLPQWRLFAGAVYQTLWNSVTGRPADFGIRDYDIAYYDPDLSEDAESERQQAVLSSVPPEIRDQVEVVNQARVHLWFEKHFGRSYEALKDTDTALRRSLFTAHAVGIRLEKDDSISIAAPYGLRDIFDLVLRPNPELGSLAAQAGKAREAQDRWPEVTLLDA